MDRIHRQAQSQRPVPPARLIMILLLVLLGTASQVSAFSLSPTHHVFCSKLPSGTTVARVSRTGSALFYRRSGTNTSDDTTTTNGAGKSSQHKQKLETHMTMQKLSDASATNNEGASLSPIGEVQNKEQDTTQKVDEYLEFLDKRYNRVHKAKRDPAKKTPFSVLAWLGQPQDHQDNSNDALYALGVAGLASERLLQKHGVTLTKCSVVEVDTPSSSETTIVVEHSSCDDDSPTLQERMPLLLRNVLATMAVRLVALKQVWKTIQKTSMVSLVRKWRPWTRLSTLKLGNFPRALLKAGGGERSVKIALSFMCIFAVYFAQPLARMAVSSRTQV